MLIPTMMGKLSNSITTAPMSARCLWVQGLTMFQVESYIGTDIEMVSEHTVNEI